MRSLITLLQAANIVLWGYLTARAVAKGRTGMAFFALVVFLYLAGTAVVETVGVVP